MNAALTLSELLRGSLNGNYSLTPFRIKSTDLWFYLAAPLDVLLVSGFFQFTFHYTYSFETQRSSQTLLRLDKIMQP